MKKTYKAPSAESVSFDTEETLNISFTGNKVVLDDKKPTDSATEFGQVSIPLF